MDLNYHPFEITRRVERFLEIFASDMLLTLLKVLPSRSRNTIDRIRLWKIGRNVKRRGKPI